MERFHLLTTDDGSLTLWDAEASEAFKSRHAAALESEKVFIDPGFREHPLRKTARPFRILELGFGLATNCLALAEAAIAENPTESPVEYLGVDRETTGLEYLIGHDPIRAQTPWLRELLAAGKCEALPGLRMEFRRGDFLDELKRLEGEPKFHAVFFDAFSPKANPTAWTTGLFRQVALLLEPGGRLVTYSVSRVTKDALEAAGFQLGKHRLPNLLQKREALVAEKPLSLAHEPRSS